MLSLLLENIIKSWTNAVSMYGKVSVITFYVSTIIIILANLYSIIDVEHNEPMACVFRTDSQKTVLPYAVMLLRMTDLCIISFYVIALKNGLKVGNVLVAALFWNILGCMLIAFYNKHTEEEFGCGSFGFSAGITIGVLFVISLITLYIDEQIKISRGLDANNLVISNPIEDIKVSWTNAASVFGKVSILAFYITTITILIWDLTCLLLGDASDCVFRTDAQKTILPYVALILRITELYLFGFFLLVLKNGVKLGNIAISVLFGIALNWIDDSFFRKHTEPEFACANDGDSFGWTMLAMFVVSFLTLLIDDRIKSSQGSSEETTPLV